LGATIVFALFFIFHAIVLLKQKNRLHLIYMLAVSFGLLITSLYLAYMGRFILRSYFVTLIPAACLLFRDVAEVWVFDKLKNRDKHTAFTLCIVLFAFFVFVPFQKAYYDARAFRESTSVSQRMAMELYAIEKTNYIYIFDISMVPTMPVLTLYTNRKPINLFFWGGAGVKSQNFLAQLEANELDELNAGSLLQPGFFFITRRSIEQQSVFNEYMENNFNAKAAIVDTFNGVYVVQFTQGC